MSASFSVSNLTVLRDIIPNNAYLFLLLVVINEILVNMHNPNATMGPSQKGKISHQTSQSSLFCPQNPIIRVSKGDTSSPLSQPGIPENQIGNYLFLNWNEILSRLAQFGLFTSKISCLAIQWFRN